MRKSSGAQLQLDIAGPARSAGTSPPFPATMGRIERDAEGGQARRCRHRQAGRPHPPQSRSPITWRRLLVVAAEDVGVGSIEAVVETAQLASDPQDAPPPGRRGRNDIPCLPPARRSPKGPKLSLFDRRRQV